MKIEERGRMGMETGNGGGRTFKTALLPFFAIKAKKSHRLILTQNEFRSKFKSENYKSSGRTSEKIFLT